MPPIIFNVIARERFNRAGHTEQGVTFTAWRATPDGFARVGHDYLPPDGVHGPGAARARVLRAAVAAGIVPEGTRERDPGIVFDVAIVPVPNRSDL